MRIELLGLLLVVPLIGCASHGLASDECDHPGQARCNGNSAEHCELRETGDGAYYAWSGGDCGPGICKLSDDERPYCTLASAPDPNCKSGAPFCDGNFVRGCTEGFLTLSIDCSNPSRGPQPMSGPPGFCVEGA